MSRKDTVRTGVFSGDSFAVLAPQVKRVVSPDARIMTEKIHAYMAIDKSFASHRRAQHSIKKFDHGEVHVNTTESFNAILERENKASSILSVVNTYHASSVRLLSAGTVEIPWKRSVTDR